jgi:hypothetical protein
VTAVPDGWSARLTDPSDEVTWLTTILDNPFELRFADGSAFAVGVSGPDSSGILTLWDWKQEGDRPKPCPTCGSPMTYAGFTIDVTDQHPDTPIHHCPQCGVDKM